MDQVNRPSLNSFLQNPTAGYFLALAANVSDRFAESLQDFLGRYLSRNALFNIVMVRSLAAEGHPVC